MNERTCCMKQFSLALFNVTRPNMYKTHTQQDIKLNIKNLQLNNEGPYLLLSTTSNIWTFFS
jgi:hypothetical protein